MQSVKRLFKKLISKTGNMPSGFIVLAAFIGLLAGAGYMLEDPMMLVNLPALAIVLCGTLLATALSYSIAELKLAFSHLKNIESVKESELVSEANQLLHFSQLWFRRSYSVIERDIETLPDNLLKKGLQMIRDRQAGDDIKALMNWKLAQEKSKDARAIKVYKSAASYAPAFGLIGTLVGIVAMLKGFNPAQGFESLAMGLSIAMVSTLYGLLLSQLIFKPTISKIEEARAQHILRMAMIAEGVVMIEQQRRPAEIRDIMNDYVNSIIAHQIADQTSPKSKSSAKAKINRRSQTHKRRSAATGGALQNVSGIKNAGKVKQPAQSPLLSRINAAKEKLAGTGSVKGVSQSTSRQASNPALLKTGS